MAKVIEVGQPVNDAERRAIALLRDGLPDSYWILHNFEIQRLDEFVEIDLAIIAPHAVYLVDVKGTRGQIDVYGPKWHPQARQPFTSPLLKLRGHAKALKGLITASQPGRRDLEGIYVDAVVLLTAPDAYLNDPDERDKPSVVTLDKAVPFFKSTSRLPAKYSRNITALYRMIFDALKGSSRPRNEPPRFGSWQVTERLSSTDAYTEYRAINPYGGKATGSVLLRVYRADPYLPTPERQAQERRIANAYQALSRLPTHPNLVRAHDFFFVEEEGCYVLVTEDVNGQALRLHLDKPTLALTLDQKLRIARDLLSALDHAHRHGVIHRNLTPSTILLASDGRVRLTSFDFARAGSDQSRTIGDAIIDELDRNYLAPEVVNDPKAATPAADLFGAGLVCYELFTGAAPFAHATELAELKGQFPTAPSAHRADLPLGFDDWLQRLCLFDPHLRPTAAQALGQLDALLAPSSDLQADQFIEQLLAATGNDIGPLLALVRNEETEWLEFKAALRPDPTKPVSPTLNDADHDWHVAKAIVALANSAGGAVLLGVDDNGQPVPLSASDPSGHLATGGWDLFVRRTLDKAFFRESGWRTATKGAWHVPLEQMRRALEVRRATLHGQDVVVLLVHPAQNQADLLLTNHVDPKKGTTENILYVRRRGDVGMVEQIEGAAAITAWQQSRQLRSPLFGGLLAQLPQLRQPTPNPPATPVNTPAVDYRNLPAGHYLTAKFVIEKRIGAGHFGVVYKVIDTLGDVARAVKLILNDRYSTLDRLKKEYRNLLPIPPHPHVVKVIDADLLSDGTPLIIFEFVDGIDVDKLIADARFAPEDTLVLARETVAGLAHIHQHRVYHCDIKPSNLIWTAGGVRIIDFNVSVQAEHDATHGGGTQRYVPPDLDRTAPPQEQDLADRDLYALGITLYEALTGHFPWDAAAPPPGQLPRDPRDLPGLDDLAPEFVNLLLKALAPRRTDRFAAAADFAKALAAVKRVRRLRAPTTELLRTGALAGLTGGNPIPPNTNPYVIGLLTLYSQSTHSNAGTRGLDALGEQIYVETALDTQLAPAVLAGEFRLVIITGNAGDGKTAFLQQLESQASKAGAQIDRSPVNGSRFTLQGRTYHSNYDGSQDEGEQASDEVLHGFLTPFAGNTSTTWPVMSGQGSTYSATRLIAINEGRLVDFLTSNRDRFPLLTEVVQSGLITGRPAHGVALVNLNLRSVVAASPDADGSIMERLIRRMTRPEFWEPCHRCDLKDRCYAFHNARTFQDETAGPQVIERLKTLYTLTHLRGRLHITLRDLRSALAYMLVGTRSCEEIHALYARGERAAILASFYFNSWLGGDTPTNDRLLKLLKAIDVGQADDPRLDRLLDFVAPTLDRTLFPFAARTSYDQDLLHTLFTELPRDFAGRPAGERLADHQRYVAMTRRRLFFERRDEGWRQMLPYRAAEELLQSIHNKQLPATALPRLLRAISRGEGLSSPERLGGQLALQVRKVEKGAIRSYRVFPADRFTLSVLDDAQRARFVEHMPSALQLHYRGVGGNEARLIINLDVYEMLQRLNAGYVPSVEETQGYYLSLAVFKNLLGAEPYRTVLLTTTGHDFYQIDRHADGRLEMSRPELDTTELHLSQS